jgi:hypothetical protein
MSQQRVADLMPLCLLECYLQGALMLLGTYSTVFTTPLGALTTLLPLAVVLVISMIQEGFADLKRHRADAEVSMSVSS